MPSFRIALAMLAVVGALACADGLLTPSPDGLTGRWTRAPEALSPSGQYVRTIEFAAGGRYLRTSEFRGIYPQQPVDAIAALTREYGTYALSADTLRFLQDSIRTWDFLGGEYLYVGRPGGYIEGPPTDPTVELSATRLTLRYMVNPGGGYVPVVEEYVREQ